jgi:hypothetical protein
LEYYNNILSVEGGWLYGGGEIMTLSQYKHLTERNQLHVVRRACKNTPALIAFDSIPERFKQIFIEKWGDPRKQVKVEQFADKIKADDMAVKFYRQYKLDDDRFLPIDAQNEYCANAAILNAIRIVLTDRKAMRKAMGGSTLKLWETMSETINTLCRDKWPHTLPANARRLKDKYNTYVTEGYESLIHAGFCNKNTEKINELAKMWILAKWASQVEKIVSENHMMSEYNEKARSEGWKEIKNVNTVHNFLFREDIKELWYAHRYGELKAKEKFGYQHKTLLPTMRDSLWYSDGTKLNYFFLDENGKVATCQVYEVMDTYSECFLGYHISKSEDFEAQFMAYKRALQFAEHKPYQITYDNQGGHKKLENGEFLKKLAHMSIKTMPYNGKSKTIESAFGRFQSEYLKKDWFFTGQNITTKKEESKANIEFILANKANLPTLAEVKAKYLQRRNEWNNAKHFKSGLPRIEMYKASENPESVKVEMWDMVDLFWVLRKEPVTCTAFGISFKEKKVKYDYVVYTEDRKPDIAWLRKNIDKKFYIKYDVEDTSLIYLYEKDATGLRFVCGAETKVEVHRGKQEQDDWEAQFFKDVELANKTARIETRDKMDAILEQHGLLPEQNGLNSPRLKGIEKAKRKAGEIGKAQKEVSNMVPELEEEEVDIYKIM